MNTINSTGINDIANFLLKNHKRGKRISKIPVVLRAWAAEAEFSASEGNDASIEIKACDSLYGRTQTFTVGSDGWDAS